MTLWNVRLYSPYTLKEFYKTVEAPSEETARKKVLGSTVTDPDGYEFDIEEDFIIDIYPLKVTPTPPYKLMPEEKVKKVGWLKGAIVEEPLPVDATPKGSPKLATVIKNALTSLIYEQTVESREYPEQKWSIKYRRDIFTKFYEEARRMSRAGKIADAVVYVVEHCPGVTVKMIADILDRNYWPIYRIVAEYVHPAKLDQLTEEVKSQATLEKWTKEDLDETLKTISKIKYLFEKEMKPAKPPKILTGPLWRGMITLYPAKRKTEQELLEELKRILTLEVYKPTPEEWEEMKKQIRKQTEAWLKQSITYWLASS